MVSSGEPNTLDPVTGVTNAFATDAFAHVYSRLLKAKVGKYPEAPDGSLEGDMAESYEVSPDRLRLTLKLRQGVKWDSRAPTSGRLMDVQDVVASWERFSKASPAAGDLAYDALRAPSAPIESFTATDDRTIVIKLRRPNAALLPLLSTNNHFWVLPREAADGGFDPRATTRGHGPYRLDDYQPSVGLFYSKNPDYYVPARPFLDKIELRTLSEAATIEAQFRAGNFHLPGAGTTIASQKILSIKQDVPEILLAENPVFPPGPQGYVSFGYEGSSPFRDVRMRRAFSMAIDREAFIETTDELSSFADQGIDRLVLLNSIVGPGYAGFYLDPADDKAFGPSNQYLKYNPPEAKKLSAAAGHGSATVDYFFPEGLLPNAKDYRLYPGMFRDAGFRVNERAIPVNQWVSDYLNGYNARTYPATTKGFSGVNYVLERAYATIDSYLFGVMHKDSSFFHGLSPDGNNPQEGDSKLNGMVEKIREESDRQRQQSLVFDLIRYFTDQSYYVPNAGQTKALNMAWPVVGNWGAFTGLPARASWAEQNLQLWFDDTKAPATR